MCCFKYIQYIVHTAVCDFIFATGTSSPLAYSMTLHNEGHTIGELTELNLHLALLPHCPEENENSFSMRCFPPPHTTTDQ